MPYNGSGVFTPPGASYPPVVGTKITVAKFTAVIDDIASALSSVITKDGQTTATAVVPFASGIQTDTIAEKTASAGVTIQNNAVVSGSLTVDTTTLVVDASNNSVGIGSSSPSTYGRIAVQSPNGLGGRVAVRNSEGAGGGSQVAGWYNSVRTHYVDFYLDDGTPASEDSHIEFGTQIAGTLATRAKLGINGFEAQSGFVAGTYNASTNPAVKTKQITGTTDAAGASSSHAHGLTGSKIKGIIGHVATAVGEYVPIVLATNGGVTNCFIPFWDATHVELETGASATTLASRPFTLWITYEV